MNRTAQTFTLGAMGLLVAGLFAAAAAHPPKTVRAVRAEAMLPAGALVSPAPSRGWIAEELLSPPGRRPDGLATYAVLVDAFGELGYELGAVAAGTVGVPKLFLATLPPDLAQVPESADRKTIFFRAVLPLILQVNEEIKAERAKLLDIRTRLRASRHVAAAERRWLAAMAERYETTTGDVDQLVKRVDAIPVSMALAQAAEESGWGSSRFVREGNALFGQWTTAVDGHQVPQARDDGRTHRVAAFASLLDSTRAYARNLNSHRAYREFRDTRAHFRADGRDLDGFDLAGTLGRYSERNGDYVRRIRGLIMVNDLRPLDDAMLDERDIRLGGRGPMALLRRMLPFYPRT